MTRRHFPLKITLALTVFAILTGGTLLSAVDSDIVLRTQQLDNSFIVPPGSTQTLTISVVRPDGTPVPGLSVIFGAPRSGPSATFPASTADDKRTLNLATDASGIAAATVVTGPDEGVFLVSGRLEGSIAVATFAFTNTTATPTPALAPTAVKVAVQDAIRSQNEVIGLTSIVHGPVWVPAGTVVASATPEIPSALVEPFVTEQASWVLWADDFPFADFGHAVRLFTIPASATAISLPDSERTRSVRWWPIIRLPGQATPTPLLVPEPEPLDAEDLDSGSLTIEGSRRNAPADHCAILLHGPNLTVGQHDIQNYRRYLLSNDLVNPNRVLRNLVQRGTKVAYSPTSRNDFDRIVKTAAQFGCTKVYLMISAHGVEPENGGGLLIKSDRDPTKNAILTFEEYAIILQQLGNAQLCLAQLSCFAGGALPALQRRGFTGSIVTASNAVEPAYHDGSGHFFLRSFLSAKQNSAAAGSDGMVSDLEALDYVNQNETSPFTFPNGLMVDRIRTAMPQGSAIQPTGTRSFTTRMVYASGPGVPGPLR